MVTLSGRGCNAGPEIDRGECRPYCSSLGGHGDEDTYSQDRGVCKSVHRLFLLLPLLRGG